MTTSCCRMSCSPTCMTATGMGCGSSWAMSWGHIRLHHVSVSLWYQIAVAYSQWIPLLGPALSRLREYSCDRHGALVVAAGGQGLVLLASGRYTETEVDLDELVRQGRQLRGF
jgi:Zn-dependent protease with chaperone function